jgi:transglutaminase-like putative cysteine protease
LPFWRLGGRCWFAPTPTNRLLAGAEHVKIGHGRRYDDIPPIKGVFRGGSGAKMESSVQMTRADASGVPA